MQGKGIVMMKNYDDIMRELRSMEDKKYKDFVAKLVPTIDKESIIGVRMGVLRKLAREIIKNCDVDIFEHAKFYYREEKLLYALCLFKMSKTLEEVFKRLDEFLIYIDSWEVTDFLAGELVFAAADAETVFSKALEYASSCDEYTARLGLVIMLRNFKSSEYHRRIISSVSSLRSDAYYVHMAAAWLLCELYYSDKTSVEAYLEGEINQDIKKKTLQKIRESLKKNR